MKTKKIVIGAMAAAMLSLSVCSLAPAFAADETVQISVGSTTAEAGEQFTVDVSIADIPSEGIQGCQFTLDFDSSVITIDSVEKGTLLDSVTSDPTSSVLPSFNSITNNKEGTVNLIWATSVNEDAYLLKGEGVFCTITGTVSAGAESGTTEIKVVPTNRETFTDSGVSNEDIDVVYNKNGEKVRCNVETVNGVITIGSGESSQPSGKYLKGDANEDGAVDVADAAAIIQSLGNKDKYALSEQGAINAECDGVPGITGMDAIRIQQLRAGLITEL
ncbi:MAG: cohesin domain-containing protein [Ruminococcus flavefaciens]|nr:cohesin domain-containing protein [Ruminococcus flavefaciens]MCM1228908.1 cohesin domain-containing protein [Ruminococcus flavefaciens]